VSCATVSRSYFLSITNDCSLSVVGSSGDGSHCLQLLLTCQAATLGLVHSFFIKGRD